MVVLKENEEAEYGGVDREKFLNGRQLSGAEDVRA